jgi:hypothetical protein
LIVNFPSNLWVEIFIFCSNLPPQPFSITFSLGSNYIFLYISPIFYPAKIMLCFFYVSIEKKILTPLSVVFFSMNYRKKLHHPPFLLVDENTAFIFLISLENTCFVLRHIFQPVCCPHTGHCNYFYSQSHIISSFSIALQLFRVSVHITFFFHCLVITAFLFSAFPSTPENATSNGNGYFKDISNK